MGYDHENGWRELRAERRARLRVGSVCSGVGGMDLGLHHAGCQHDWFIEADAYRRRVLNRHWPGIPIHDDLRTVDPGRLAPVDLLAGGTPCQDLSVAGGRAGLDGARSSLFWHLIRLRDALEPEWLLWENVEGTLWANKGVDFARVLGALVGATAPVPARGWGRAGVVAGPLGGAVWRLLDAQYFGVPQRRRRVFVVARLGDACPPEVLFERDSRSRNPPARTRAPENTAPACGGGVAGDRGRNAGASAVSALRASPGGPDDNAAQAGWLVAATLHAPRGRAGGALSHQVTHALTSRWHDGSEDGTGRGTPLVAAPVTGHHRKGFTSTVENGMLVPDGPTVRRLTPTECERLMGWPDGWTLDSGSSLLDAPLGVPGDAGAPVCAFDPRPDGRRYSACGDGVVAPARLPPRSRAAVMRAPVDADTLSVIQRVASECARHRLECGSPQATDDGGMRLDAHDPDDDRFWWSWSIEVAPGGSLRWSVGSGPWHADGWCPRGSVEAIVALIAGLVHGDDDG